MVRNLPAMQADLGLILGREDPLEKDFFLKVDKLRFLVEFQYHALKN